MRESHVEDYLRERVKAEGGEIRKARWIGRRGAPDDVVFLRGAHFVECKAPGKPLEPHQQREHDRMRCRGVRVWKIDTLEDVDKFLRYVKTRGHE